MINNDKNPDKKNSETNEDLSHSMVHYLLAIHKLKDTRGFARVTDIARELNLTKGSVSTALNNLKKKNLIREEDDCKFLLLTDKGHDEVHRILSSRTLLFYFLRDFVGVSETLAFKDSCSMEHLMSDETREKFFEFMKDLACTCERMEGSDNPLNYKFRTALDLCHYPTIAKFQELQVGDGPMSPENHLSKK